MLSNTLFLNLNLLLASFSPLLCPLWVVGEGGEWGVRKKKRGRSDFQKLAWRSQQSWVIGLLGMNDFRDHQPQSLLWDPDEMRWSKATSQFCLRLETSLVVQWSTFTAGDTGSVPRVGHWDPECAAQCDRKKATKMQRTNFWLPGRENGGKG